MSQLAPRLHFTYKKFIIFLKLRAWRTVKTCACSLRFFSSENAGSVFKCKWKLSPVFLIIFLSISPHCNLGPFKYREYGYGLFNCHYLYYHCFFVFVEREKFLMQLKRVSTRRETQCDTCLRCRCWTPDCKAWARILAGVIRG